MKKVYCLIMLFVFIGCDKNTESLDPELVQELQTEIKDNVELIDDSVTVVSDLEEIMSGTLTVEPSSSVEDIEVGDVLIGEDDGGFLVKVLSKTDDGGQTTFQTVQATLEDVFENAEFSFFSSLDDVAGRNGEGYNFDFSNSVIYEDGPIVFKISQGNASFNPNFTFDFDIENSTLQSFEFKAENAELTIDCDLFFGIESQGGLNITKSLDVFDKTFTTFVGWVPVVVTVTTELEAELTIESNAQFGFTGGFTSVNTTTLGASYNDGAWSNIAETNSGITGKPVDNTAVAGLTQNLTITPKVSVKFYNVVGPYCEPEFTEDLEVGLNAESLDWNAKIDAGLDLRLGAEAEVLGYSLVNYQTSIYTAEVNVWDAPKVLELVSGDNQNGTQGGQLEEPLKVVVKDNYDDPVANVPVHFSVATNDGEVDNTSVMTNDEGIAEVIWTLGTLNTEQSVSVEIRNSTGEFIGPSVVFNASAEEAELFLSGDLNFGDVPIGTTENRVFTIENEAAVVANVSSIDVPDGYSLDWNSGAIPAQSTQNITVTFSPTLLQEYNGNLIVNNDIDDINNLIEVTGTGTVENALALSGDLNFGDVAINDSDIRVLTIQNNTIIPMNVTSVNLPSGFTSNWNSGIIDGQSSQNVEITFLPTQIQPYNGTLTVNNDLDSENNTLQIIANGVEENTGPDIAGFWISDIEMSDCNAAANSNDQGCVNHTTFEGLELEFSVDPGYTYCENTSISCGIVYNDGVYLNSEVFIERSFNFDGTNLRVEIRTYSTSGYFFDDRTFIFEGTYIESSDSFSGTYSHETDGGLWNNMSTGTMTLTRP